MNFVLLEIMGITIQRAEKHLAEATHNLIHTMDN